MASSPTKVLHRREIVVPSSPAVIENTWVVPIITEGPLKGANAVTYAGYRAVVNVANDSKEGRYPRVYLKTVLKGLSNNNYIITLGFGTPQTRVTFEIYSYFVRNPNPDRLGIEKFGLTGPSVPIYWYGEPDRGFLVLAVGYEPPQFKGRVSLSATFKTFPRPRSDDKPSYLSVLFYISIDPSILSPINNPPIPQLSLPSLSEETCPRIKIYYSTDLWGGNEMAQVLMQEVGQPFISQYLRRFGDYVVSLVAEDPCPSFMSKVLQIVDRDYPVEETGRVTEGIATYGLLRYFLWYLITGRWDLNILRRSLTPQFQAALLSSKYACWNVYLQQPTLQEFAKYFIQ